MEIPGQLAQGILRSSLERQNDIGEDKEMITVVAKCRCCAVLAAVIFGLGARLFAHCGRSKNSEL